MHLQKQKTCKASNHVCKINAPRTRTYPYEVSATKRSSLQPVVRTLSFIVYACRIILGGIVTDILGDPRHTAFVAPCSYSYVGMYVAHAYNYVYSYNYIRVTFVYYIFHFRLVQEAEQKALILLYLTWCGQPSAI